MLLKSISIAPIAWLISQITMELLFSQKSFISFIGYLYDDLYETSDRINTPLLFEMNSFNLSIFASVSFP